MARTLAELRATADAANPAGASRKPVGASFADHIRAAIEQTRTDLQTADGAARAVAQGKGDIVESMVALSKAELSLRQVTTLRNRALESYQQIMRIQL